jgi:hypothetical protein
VFIIGAVCGTLAAVIEKSSNLLEYWKLGYCVRDWTLELPFCCPFPDGIANSTSSHYSGIYLFHLILELSFGNGTSMPMCEDWKQWSQVLSPHSHSAPSLFSLAFWIDYSFFILLGMSLAMLSSVLVFYTSSSSPVHLSSVARARTGSLSRGLSQSSSTSSLPTRRASGERRRSTTVIDNDEGEGVTVEIRRFHSAHSVYFYVFDFREYQS